MEWTVKSQKKTALLMAYTGGLILVTWLIMSVWSWVDSLSFFEPSTPTVSLVETVEQQKPTETQESTKRVRSKPETTAPAKKPIQDYYPALIREGWTHEWAVKIIHECAYAEQEGEIEDALRCIAMASAISTKETQVGKL